MRFDNMCCRLRRIGDRHARFKLFSYLDFRVCFACYPPESFKVIFLTCIWLKIVDTSFDSSQKQPQITSHVGRHISSFGKSLREAQNSPGAGTRHIIGLISRLNVLTSCGPNLAGIESNAVFCVSN